MVIFLKKQIQLVFILIWAFAIQNSYAQEVENFVDTKENFQLEIPKEETNKKQNSLAIDSLTIGIGIILIITLLVLIVFLLKKNKLKEQTNNLLRIKNAELRLSKEKAEKETLAKTQVLSTITHELRTPLYAVTGLTHLLLEETTNSNQKEHLNSLKFSGEHLLSLINNILDLNKLEANKVEIAETPFSLKKQINEVLITLQKSTENKNINLSLNYDESIPKKIIGDPLKLSQILINLIGNSIKFTQKGGVTISVIKLDSEVNKVNLQIIIKDTGVGISQKKQKDIFETFSQGSLQINNKYGGTGLGLSIVKNLLELMNSEIYLESVLGQGSKFWFDISFNIPVGENENLMPDKKEFEIDYTYLENINVLIVEDDKVNQMITKKILEKRKLQCKIADSGYEAIELIQKNDFEIVLMDIHMPGINGIETTLSIREFDKNLPIIALTAVTIDEKNDEIYGAGFNGIIPKPFKPEILFEKIYLTLKNNKVNIN